jgi:hypothetical protein
LAHSNSVRLPSRRLSLPEIIAQKPDASPLIFLDCLSEVPWYSRRSAAGPTRRPMPKVDTRTFIAARLIKKIE